MALAKIKQADILTKAKEIESLLCEKYKRLDKTLTFGSKLKSLDTKFKNPFLKDALWSIVKTRNYIAHENDFKISLKEYELFLAEYTYVKKFV